MSTDSDDLTTAPWGAFAPSGSSGGRRVSWGSPLEVQVEGPVVPSDARHAAPKDERPTEAPATGSETSGNLGDLFGSPSPAPSEPVSAASAGRADDLGGLFGASTETPPVEAEVSSAGDDLGGLFGASLGAQTQAAETAEPSFDLSSVFGNGEPELPAGQDGPAPSTSDPGLGSVFDDGTHAQTSTAGTHAEAEAAPNPFTGAAFGASASPFGAPASPGAPAAPAEPAPTSMESRFAAQRAAVEAARAERAHDATALDMSAALANNARYLRAAELEPLVERLLGLGGSAGDPELASFIKHLELTRDVTLDAAQRAQYQQLLAPRLATSGIQFLTEDDMRLAFDIAYDEMIGIGPLGPLWRDDAISEIMVSGPDRVTIERQGRLELTPVRFSNLAHLETVARRLGAASQDDRAISSTNPLVTIHLPGARVQFVWRPLAVNKVVIVIRKFGELLGIDKLLGFGSVSPEMVEFLAAAVRSRATILVSGGTNSGKTTVINALSEFIPDSERVITIEDALELQLRNTHVEALVTKEAASADDRVLFGQDELLKATLRLNPDRIIVGEIRDAKGAAVMLEAANTGHDGTMTTVHANSPRDALRRLAKLLRRADGMPDDAAREEVGSAIDLVVQVVKVRGRRFISHVSTVDPETCETRDVFVGEYAVGADAPTFRLDAGLGADTAVALKMTDTGIDPSAWRR